MIVDAIAKLRWREPVSGEAREYILTEGATATIGRSSNNDIHIPEQHVSRQHSVIQYRDGIFVVSDLGSSNGTFVNDNRVDAPYPLFAGDVIRLFVPIVEFLAVTDEDISHADETGNIIIPTKADGQASLIITTGPQEEQTIPLLLSTVTVGRATSVATWDVLIQDPSVSRPHARFDRIDGAWQITDLGSSNGTKVNSIPVKEKPQPLRDGDRVELGYTVMLFRVGWRNTANADGTNSAKTTAS